MNNKFFVSLLVCIIAAGGLGFYGGMTYGKKQTPDAGAGRPGANGAMRGQGFPGGGAGPAGGRAGANGAGGGFSNGEVVGKDANSVTLKLMDGGSKIVLVASSTRVGKMTDGSMADLTNGTNVMVTGTANQDGSLTASTIQIRPASSTEAFMMRGRVPGQPAPQQP